MKKITIFILLSILGYGSSVYDEPSIYGAGDINSASPYGLTETEQMVLENKKTLQMLFNRLNEQQRKIDGLNSIIDGQSKEIFSLKEQLETQSQMLSQQPEQDDNQTYNLLLEMGQMIDNINNTYVTKDELKKALAGSRPRRSSSNLGSPVRGNSASTYRRAVQLFGKRSYQASKEHFEVALSGNYKPASSNYYLGEIAYYTRNYADAVAYYKQSASLYETASYMPVLFLHTAISLNKIGQKEQARAFFNLVIDNYPHTRAAAIAKNRL